MVEPVLLVGLAGHLCHEPRLLLPRPREGLQGAFFSPTSLNLRSLAGAASVRALRQPGEHDGLAEAELVRGKKVSHL